MTRLEAVLILAIIGLIIFGLSIGPSNASEQVQLTPEEFATEVCTQLKDKGLISIKYNGVKYDCKEYAKEE